MAPRLLVVGRTSFIAGHTLDHLPPATVRAVRHDALENANLLDGIETVIGFAKHPAIGSDDYDLERDDPDVRLARSIGERPVRLVVLSTRKVYAPAAVPLAEDAPVGPVDAYGRNKLRVETRLRAMLGERLTVLRLGNVFGDERQPGRRTFLAILLTTLARAGRIRFDMSPFVTRDFLPAGRCGAILAALAVDPPGGMVNVGSGIALPTGRLALWILEGFGRGDLVITDPREHDPFVLDVGRLAARVGPPCTLADLEAACRDLGRRLARSEG